MHHDDHRTNEHRTHVLLAQLLSWKGIAFTLVLAAFSYYLLSVHLEHLALALPYVILLACPLMHIFGHGRHHGSRDMPGKEGQDKP